MIHNTITLEDVKSAYRKLKSMAYYDSNDLFLKDRIASFETDVDFTFSISSNFKHIDFQSKLENLHQALTDDSIDTKIEYWDKLYNQIGYKVLPKKVKSYNDYNPCKAKNREYLIESIFTNIREIEDDATYEFDKLTLFFDAPVEIHLISILWIMKLGYRLEGDLMEKCYGNRLLLDLEKANSDQKKVTDDLGLFKPYYKQYQKWRDEGITVAKNFLDNKQDVLFFNIDIKDYYYSVRFSFSDLNNRLGNKENNTYSVLSKVFEQTHFIYTEKLKNVRYPNDLIDNIMENESILPIGLASSYVLANWYLKEFDSRVHQNIRPIYYSRYVDDIFIITANPDPRFTSEDKCETSQIVFNEQFSKSYYETLTNEEKHIIKILYPVITIENTPKELLKIEQKIGEKIFKINCYKNLYIQPSKTLVYFFDHNSSLALLEKFKNEIEKRSSEFRFLPDEKLAENGFDDEAYELIFDDSLHKVKTLKDYKENRYGIASHLSKKIFYSLRNGKTDNQKDAKKILKFFKGTTNLEHFRQWERLLTYFVVNNNKKEFIEFSVYTFEQIFRLPINKRFKTFHLNYTQLAEDLLDHFSIAMEITFSLNPSFHKSIEDKVTKVFKRLYNDSQIGNNRPLNIFTNWQKFRLSNMMRHNYVNIPLLNYTEIKLQSTLLGTDFSKIDMNDIDFSENHLEYSPRKVRFCEVAWMVCIKRVHNVKAVPFQNRIINDSLFNEDEGELQYLDESFELYYRINYWHKLGDISFKEALKREIFDYGEAFHVSEETNGVQDWNLLGHEISVNHNDKLDKLRVGLANMKVDNSNYEASMLGKPNLTNRYLQFAKILNEAEAEQCDLVVLPELSLPHGLVKTILEESWNHQRAIVSGIEHWKHNNVAFNFILSLLPCKIKGIKDTVPILRLKNHYAPSEEFWINEYRRVVPKPSPYRYHLLRWKGLYFTNYYCFELADIVHRTIFRSKIDFLIASEWNKDINFYSNITETTSRDLHCYFIQVNTSDYGDSRVTRPKKTESRDSLRIKGGLNTSLLVDELDIKKLRAFQYKGFGLQAGDKEFKPTPADYKHEDARKRQENMSFKKNS